MQEHQILRKGVLTSRFTRETEKQRYRLYRCLWPRSALEGEPLGTLLVPYLRGF